MSCISPNIIRSKAKDAMPNQTEYVRCGKCTNCLKDKQNEWVYRCELEDSVSKHSLFATLTYNESSVPLMLVDTREIITYKEYIRRKSLSYCEMTINPKDLCDYWKRVRKALPDLKDYSFKYYACMEYGDQFNRPHAHYVLFTDYHDFKVLCDVLDWCWSEFGLGFTAFDPIIAERLDYVTKDISKKINEAPPSEYSLPVCHRVSECFGDVGFLRDLNDYQTMKTDFNNHLFKLGNYRDQLPDYPQFVTMRCGCKIPVPRYFREKFFIKKDYLTENQIERDEKRFKTNYKKALRIYQDLSIKGYEPTDARIFSAISSNSNVERVRRDVVTARLRRKCL